MKVREMPQIVIRVKPSSKDWIVKKSKEEERSQNFIINKALELAMEIDDAKAASNTK